MNFPRSILLAIIYMATLVSLFPTLFYSQKIWIVGVAAFLVVWATGFFGRRDMLDGTDVHRVGKLLTIVLGAAIFVSLVTLFSTAANDGVCVTNGEPIFAERPHYVLTNHGTKTEVSRARYLAVGASFQVGWHFMILFVATQLFMRRDKTPA